MLYSQHLGLYVCIFTHTECCCRCMCCYAAVVAAAAVLLAAVRRRVPDGKICCWFIEADFSVLLFYFSSFKHDFVFYAFTASIYVPGIQVVEFEYGGVVHRNFDRPVELLIASQ